MASLRPLAFLVLAHGLFVAPSRAAELSAGIEVQHDRFHYHFDNDSTWDTAFLVPHFFEQRYSSVKHLLVLRAQSASWDFEIAATPVRTANGSDYDTFFQPSGDVVVHGSTTDVDARSWRVVQRFAIGGRWRAGVGYSRDQMKFPTSLSTTTHTMPPSATSSLSTTRESTASEVLDFRIGVAWTKAIGGAWEIGGDFEAAPVTVARLTTYLPDKYDHPVPFTATGFTAIASAAATWRSGRMFVAMNGRVGGGRSYKRSATFTRDHAAASIAIGVRR